MLRNLLKGLFGARQTQDSTWLARAAAFQRDGRFADAAAVCEVRLATHPTDTDALQGLAAAQLAQGRTQVGIALLRRTAALMPADWRLHATLARVHTAVGDIDEAIARYRQALTLQPDSGTDADALAELLRTRGRYDEAEDCCRAALAACGDTAQRRHTLAAALFEQGRVDEAIAELKASLAMDPAAAHVHSDLLRALNYVADPETVFAEHRAWGLRHAEALGQNAPPHTNDPVPNRRLRVGYVSPYFRKHAVTFFLEPAIEHRDREAFDVVLFADVSRPDEYSERLKAHGAQWRNTVGASDEALARIVRDEGIDILVDLSGHTPGNRLLAFARRPAPVQATWNGYPNTTGMIAVDYRISDAFSDPPGLTERLHTERLVRLPRVYMAWRPPTDAPESGPPPALASGRITFGSFNSCYKISGTAVELWSRVLGEMPGSRLLLFTVPCGRAASRLRERFAACGIAADRIELRSRLPHEAFLEAHREVDIALDSFPYHGTTTTCFSLWMGVPVVSLTGSTHVSRVGVSMLSSIGLEKLAVTTAEDYVAAACRLAQDVQTLAILRAGLRERMRDSPLTDGPSHARALDRAYREMWRTWCSSAAIR